MEESVRCGREADRDRLLYVPIGVMDSIRLLFVGDRINIKLARLGLDPPGGTLSTRPASSTRSSRSKERRMSRNLMPLRRYPDPSLGLDRPDERDTTGVCSTQFQVLDLYE